MSTELFLHDGNGTIVNFSFNNFSIVMNNSFSPFFTSKMYKPSSLFVTFWDKRGAFHNPKQLTGNL